MADFVKPNTGYTVGSNRMPSIYDPPNSVCHQAAPGQPFRSNTETIQINHGRFRYDDTLIRAQWDTIGQMYHILKETYATSKALSKEIEGDATFQGQSRNELLAFSDLLNQYNGSFVSEGLSTDPAMKYNKATSTCIYKVANFNYSQKAKGIK